MNNQLFHLPENLHNDVENQLPDNSDFSARRYIARLRLQFLTPIVVTLSFAALVIIAVIYLNEYQDIDNHLIQLQSTSSNLIHNSIQQDARALRTVMDVLKVDAELAYGLASQDRKRLLNRATPIYEDLNRHYGITHFYFTDPQRVNLLRVHKPQKYGDTINRQSTLIAQHGGTDAYGVELGPLGTLTLRYVRSWYDEKTQELIGFVELGMEVDNTVDSIRDLFGVDVFVLINKSLLEQSGWEDGMRTFGRQPNWDLFPQVVVGMHGTQAIPRNLSAYISKLDFTAKKSVFKTKFEHDDQFAIFQPIEDMSGRSVGTLVLLVDISNTAKLAVQAVVTAAIAVIVAAIVLSLFFYWFVGRIGERMAHNEWELKKTASHDGLTGLLNRREFNRMLEEFIARYNRHKNPISLLLIDVDYFKKVNDTYGHQSGDAVLVELAKRLKGLVRIGDRVCRYGGEEFVILLPESNAVGASAFATRLCEAMSGTQWDLGNDTWISVTISVGVASCPDHETSAEGLLCAADKALYTAKENGRNRVCNYGELDKGSCEL